MRFFECAASRPSFKWPAGSRSKSAPAVCSSRTRAGPSSTSTCTAAASHRAAPAANVSWRWSAGESPAPSAAAIPPCAYAVALSNSERLVSSSTSPCCDARQAVCKPATPLPTTRNLARMRSDMRERYHRRLAAIFPRGETFEMRKLLILVGALLVVHVALLFVHVPGAAQPAPRDAVTVGLVLDVGGLGDKSFNDGAYRGAERAEKELGAHIRLIEPGEATDREAGLRLLAAEKMDLVIGVGFIFTDDINQLAKEYPNVNFADVDYSVATDKDGNVLPPPPNVAALKFKEEEGSFLVGAIAALAGNSKKVGFVGGLDVPLMFKFEAGYKAGVKAVCPDCTVIVQYAGVTPEAFRNPGKGKELGLSQYEQGVNVIYHASGSTGLGVFEAARQTGKYAIGVDADQYSEAPGRVMTSMVKGIDVAVFDMIKRAKEGTFKGGVYTFGLPESGVAYIYDANNRALIADSVRARVEQLKADIIAGKIQVPSTR